MSQQGTEVSVEGLTRFYSKDELRRYMKSLVERYQAQDQKFGDTLGGLLRNLEKDKAAVKVKEKESKDKEKSGGKPLGRGWVKMGTMAVNTSDPNGAMAEVLFQLHEETKARLARAGEALKSFEEMSNTLVPEAGMYYLQVRNGIPERIIVDLQSSKKSPFNFTADFRLV